MTEWIRFGTAAFLLLAGVFASVCAVTGVFRFRFVMNRMHCAAILDSLASLLILSGAAVAGWEFSYLWKLALVLAALWLGSPLASHMLSRLELNTDETAPDHLRVPEEEDADGRV